ncbi:spore coat polysaccharide biosynthesis glycosyltransferase ExoK [Pyxidicoccus xibeiensis]|uniref:spore coat polysaccharide biosynthesis glycosyltransferase ExoK n=1 Tax=Pyxidicoccus xibeiensis TaxID=2906759 RepID=UPI0020A7ED74|nr:spore coat polysaccharide biosynthesis glycosyltransferase ExoK [Pyxidicoccus xibeiensis]MCP3142467.1 spore coat polysaccharide biosynthesis glycosyltransferase ExoK [Pyxidicoccus xibeiensis]
MRREEVRMGREPLRLVQFTRSFHIGGTEVQVLELLRGLPSSYRLQVSVLEDAGPLMGAVWKLGHAPESFPLKGSVAQPNTAYQVYRMAKWLKAHRVELVHVHDFYSTLIAVPAAKLAGAKVIVGRLDLSHWQGRARRLVHAKLTGLADHVVANAEAIRGMLVNDEGLPASRVSVIHNGLDLPRFDARVREGLKGPLPDTRGAPVVVHVANMNHPVKRQEDLLVALAMLRHAGTPLHAWLVGDGPRRPELERLAGELGVSDTVHFLRHRPDVPAIYARATFGVLCSTAEGMSNAVMEGMAAGLPMVVTRVGGNTDLVLDGERGLVVPPEQPAQLAQAFTQLLSNPEKARGFGRAAREFVRRELSLEKMVRLHDALYQRVARGTGT